MVSAIITCAGSGERAGFGFNKLLKDIGGITPFEKTVCAFADSGVIDEIIVVCAKQDEETFKQKCLDRSINAAFITGSTTRSKSVQSGLEAVSGDVVLIHDGARPFVSGRVIRDCVKTAAEFGSAITAVPATDTIAEVTEENGEKIILSSSREGKYAVQTPQGFKTELIRKAFSLASDDEVFSDESGVFCKYIGKCHIVDGETANKKLTYAEDFSIDGNGRLYVGTGFDLHLLVEGRKLILGGVEIPHDKGLLGHSDADVLTHAIMDALLSSASLGDIGRHFPDTDDKYKGISSILLLQNVLGLLKKSGYKPINVSAVIQAQKPKLSGYVDAIRANLAKNLGLDESAVGITCTTLEGIGIVGREEGIAVQAYCLTKKES